MNLDINQTSFAAYFNQYIDLVRHYPNVSDALNYSSQHTLKVVSEIPVSKNKYRYAKNKWSINDLLVHIIDTELIFCTRALRIARNDKQNLLGFDHDNFVSNANADNRNIKDIIEEYQLVKQNTIGLFKSFTPKMLKQKGKVNNNELSVLAIAYIIAGHETHHINVLTERYL